MTTTLEKKFEPAMTTTRPDEYVEPILRPSSNRFKLFPIQHEGTFELYLKQVASFWTVSEVDLGQDKKDFASMTQEERDFIGNVLAFFAQSDGVVNENLAKNFSDEVQVPEIRQFYEFQIGIETIHKHMYGLMIDTFETLPVRRNHLFNAIDTVPSVKAKAEWAMRWTERDRASFVERLVAFACVEGIFFSASFCAIYYLKKRGLMPGLTFSNELIARDEALHRDFACHVYTSFVEKPLSQARVHDIVKSAVDCEGSFVREALRVDLIGMNAKLMQQYVEFVADHLLMTLGYEKLFRVENPFTWMELISLEGKTNFFEKRVGEYQKSGVMDSTQPVDVTFSTDADF